MQYESGKRWTYESVSLGDWRASCELFTLVGCAFTRFQTRRMLKAFPTVLNDQLISYGPCQFPTLGFVVERVRALYTAQSALSK